MGQPKGFLQLHGHPLIEYPLRLLKIFCDEIFVVAQSPEPFSHLKVKILTDIFPDGGPMGGIFTGLQSASHPWSLVLACDMPYVRKQLVEKMIEQIELNSRVEAIVPLGPDRLRGKISMQPLCALYSKKSLPLFHQKLQQGFGSLVTTMAELETRAIHWLELDEEDLAGVSFTNLNTPMEMEQAKFNPPWRLLQKRAYC